MALTALVILNTLFYSPEPSRLDLLATKVHTYNLSVISFTRQVATHNVTTCTCCNIVSCSLSTLADYKQVVGVYLFSIGSLNKPGVHHLCSGRHLDFNQKSIVTLLC